MSADRALQELAEQVEDPNSRLRLGEVREKRGRMGFCWARGAKGMGKK